MNSILRFVIILLLSVLTAGLQAQQFTNYTTTDGLPSNNVICVLVDAANVKWFGTQSGVGRFNDTSWTTFTKEDGLIDNYINCIATDTKNHIWVGTDVGVSTYDGSQWTSYTTSNGLVDNTITCIASAPDGSIWIGSNSGASNYDGTTWKHYTTADGLPQNMISAIQADASGNVWFGTWLGGLSKFNGSTFKNFTTADSLVDNNISAIAFDAAGNTWIGTYEGITLLNNLDQWVVNYRTGSGILPLYVKDLDVDSKGTLWVGIYADYLQDGGISKFKDQAWTTYTVTNGLANRMVQGIAHDADDNIWIATGDGVSKLNDQNSGIGDETSNQISLYPNPASHYLFISGSVLPNKITVFDVTGKKVLTLESGQVSSTIDIRSLPAGIYFIQMNTKSGQTVQKVMKR